MRAFAAACLSALALAGDVRAEPTLDAFKTLCTDTGGAGAAALAAADAAGWMSVPAYMTYYFSDAGFAVGEMRMRSDREALYFLVTGTRPASPANQILATPVCGVGVFPEKPIDLPKLVSDSLGMPSVDLGLRGVTAFAYSEIAGARKSIDLNDNRSEALLRRGAVSVVMVADVKSNTPIGDGGIVFLMKPTM